MKFISFGWIFASFAWCLCYPKTIEQMQVLHKDIGRELMRIRTKFTTTRQDIYALLDRIDKMYNLAKNTAEKHKILKIELHDRDVELKNLRIENLDLKEKISEMKKEIAKYSDKSAQLDKELQVEKVQAAILSREKNELMHEKDELHGKMLKLKIDGEKDSKKEAIPDNILKELSEEEKSILSKSQNLTRSSTSAPSSPR